MEAQDKKVLKKKSGFFQNHSPFRRKSTKEVAAASNRNTWHPSNSHCGGGGSSSGAARGLLYGGEPKNLLRDRTASPDPIDANAPLALNIGQNLFTVSTPDRDRRGGGGAAMSQAAAAPAPEDDPIAMALAELKGVTLGKQSSVRVSADHYHGIATPAPGGRPFSRAGVAAPDSAVAAGKRGTPPPSYDQQVQRLGVPSPAVTSRAMKETSQKFVEPTRNLFVAASRPRSAAGYAAQGGSPGN